MGSVISQKSQPFKMLYGMVQTKPSQFSQFAQLYDKNQTVFSLEPKCLGSQAYPRSSNLTKHHVSQSARKNNNKSANGINLTTSRVKNKQIKKVIIKRVPITIENQLYIQAYIKTSNLVEGRLCQQHSYKHNMTKFCSLLGYQKQYQSFACGGCIAIQFAFQYEGQHTIQQQVRQRAAIKAHCQQTMRNDQIIKNSFSIDQIMRVQKLLFECCIQLCKLCEDHSQQQIMITKFNLGDIIITTQKERQESLSYRHPLDSLLFYHRQPVQKYQNVFECFSECNIESNLLIDIGICIMSMCLLQDCSQILVKDSMCDSLLQRYIQRIFQIYNQKYNEYIARALCEMIQKLVNHGKNQNNLSIDELKSFCNKFYITYQSYMTKVNRSYIQLQKSAIFENTKGSDHLESMQIINRIQNKCNNNRANNNYNILKNQTELASKSLILQSQKSEYQHIARLEVKNAKKSQVTQINKQKTNKNKGKNDISSSCYYEQIDNKWSNDEIFRNMPTFQQLSEYSRQQNIFEQNHHHSIMPKSNNTIPLKN